MSLITVSWMDGDLCGVRCSVCGSWCFTEEVAVVADMAKRGVVPYCWLCDPENGEALPAHLYYLDETFLLGIGDRCFLAHWQTDDLEIRQADLTLAKISPAVWHDLKTGRVQVLHKKRL